MLALLWRTGLFTHIKASAVYANDTDETARRRLFGILPPPILGAPVGYLAGYITTDGTENYTYMTIDEVLAIRNQAIKRNNGKLSSAWSEYPDSMAKKTVLKKLYREQASFFILSKSTDYYNRIQQAEYVDSTGETPNEINTLTPQPPTVTVTPKGETVTQETVNNEQNLLDPKLLQESAENAYAPKPEQLPASCVILANDNKRFFKMLESCKAGRYDLEKALDRNNLYLNEQQTAIVKALINQQISFDDVLNTASDKNPSEPTSTEPKQAKQETQAVETATEYTVETKPNPIETVTGEVIANPNKQKTDEEAPQEKIPVILTLKGY